MLAADIAMQSASEAEAALDAATFRTGGLIKASLSSDDMPGLLTEMVEAGPHGMLGLEVEQTTLISDLSGRGAAAFALAGLFTLLSARRRKGVPAPITWFGHKPVGGQANNLGWRQVQAHVSGLQKAIIIAIHLNDDMYFVRVGHFRPRTFFTIRCIVLLISYISYSFMQDLYNV